MKSRMVAFFLLILIAMIWHSLLISGKKLNTTAQTSEPDYFNERSPSSSGNPSSRAKSEAQSSLNRSVQ